MNGDVPLIETWSLKLEASIDISFHTPKPGYSKLYLPRVELQLKKYIDVIECYNLRDTRSFLMSSLYHPR